MKLNASLLALITKMEPIDFVGLARLLGVSIIADKEPRPFADVLEDVLKKFDALPRGRKREVLKLVKKSCGK